MGEAAASICGSPPLSFLSSQLARTDRSGLRLRETAAQLKTVLFLHSFGPNFQPWATWSREIGRELNRQSPWPLDIQEQSLVTARGGDDPSEAKFAEYLGALYAQRPPDLIVASGAPAARFVQQTGQTCFRQRRCCSRRIEVRRVDQSTLSEQDAVVGLRTDYVVLFENILRLLPETKAIAIIVGKSPNERFWAGRAATDTGAAASEQG